MTNEQRQEYRLALQLPVFLELPNGDNPPTIVVSHSLDVSANGLRVITDRPIPLGCIVQTCVQEAHNTQQFLLITEVKWQSDWRNKGEFLVGLALFESKDSHIQEWKKFVASQHLASQ